MLVTRVEEGRRGMSVQTSCLISVSMSRRLHPVVVAQRSVVDVPVVIVVPALTAVAK